MAGSVWSTPAGQLSDGRRWWLRITVPGLRGPSLLVSGISGFEAHNNGTRALGLAAGGGGNWGRSEPGMALE